MSRYSGMTHHFAQKQHLPQWVEDHKKLLKNKVPRNFFKKCKYYTQGSVEKYNKEFIIWKQNTGSPAHTGGLPLQVLSP